jgi:protoporphyrinogen oxidase
MQNVDTLVIGAGVSGLAYAMCDRDAYVVESQPEIGGHARSFFEDGFTFDRGPHIIFSKNKEILELMLNSLGDNVHTCKRNNKVVIGNELFSYPLENSLKNFDPEVKFNVLNEILIDPTFENSNLLDWFYSNFGKTLTNLYFKPYNEKIWKYDVSQLSMSWADRIPKPSKSELLRGAIVSETEGYVHQLFYQYPKFGGYDALGKSWGLRVGADRIRLNSEIKSIEKFGESSHVTTFETNEQITTDKIISTIPIKELCMLLNDVPEKVITMVDDLPINPITVITFAFEGEQPNDYTAVYIPDSQIPFHRVSYPKIFSPFNCPIGHYSIQIEITHPFNSQPMTKNQVSELENFSLKCLVDLNLVSNEVPKRTWSHYFKHGYVVYNKNYEVNISAINQYFNSRNIFLLGRFGAHRYVNVDMCLYDAIELAKSFNKYDIKKFKGLMSKVM